MGLMRVLVTRPEPDARQEADALRARGYEPVLAPLLDIEFLKGVPLDLDGVQAVVITSRNALRALADHPQREAVAALPLFAVGEATAWAGRSLVSVKSPSAPAPARGCRQSSAGRCIPKKGRWCISAPRRSPSICKPRLRTTGSSCARFVLYRSHPG
ncbi:hypothetical protein AUC71_09720 [Methyloceanibacter marginalis]|uniref:Tetrapyrrole biosynthesis uroporphyrinogen III synthase domain-containing protein n=1 Tax=Methyloceanibacter marginalis TaxID=1774971 RepID=A0A1E3WCA9_9HYPH|nr:uroporphyrinogen-III synthase [Methyloceanibacter marginalis]ODS03449.1 hypothetical protein AUC71_09720 [Methyloceanibacter marginalis]